MRLRGVVVVAAAGLLWLACALATLAASPSPEPAVGDPRSSGQGPGLVGDPGFALLAVVADRRRHGRGDPHLRPIDGAQRRLSPVGPSDYWQEL